MDARWRFGLRRFLMLVTLGLTVPTLIGCNTNGGVVTENIQLAGRVVDGDTGEWLNDRLVIAFRKGAEVGRATSTVGSFAVGKIDTVDGVARLTVPNTYHLTTDMMNRVPEAPVFEFVTEGGLLDQHNYIGAWIGDLPEGSDFSLSVPDKNFAYLVKVFQGVTGELPAPLLVPGSAYLRDDGKVVVSLGQQGEGLGSPPPGMAVADVAGVKTGVSTATVRLFDVTSSMDNCSGTAAASQTFTKSQTFVHEYAVEAGATVGVDLPVLSWLGVVAQLEATYGYQQGQVDTETLEYTLVADPGTSKQFVVTFEEVWDSGSASVRNGSDTITVPFRVRTGVQNAVRVIDVGCT